MLTVRVLPRRGTTLRAAAATVEVTTVLALGHVWAGGALPSVPWLGVMAAAVFGAGLLVLRGRVRPLVALPVLVVAQLLLHAWLTALTAPGAADAHLAVASHVPAPSHTVLDPSMLAVHAVGGLVTVVLWELRTRAAEVVVTWTRQPLPPVPAPARQVAPVLVPSSPVSASVVGTAPRRGPPVGLVTV